VTRPLVISHPAMLDHRPGAGHPERPDRLRAIEAALADAPITRRAAKPAAREAIERIHPAAFVDRILALDGEAARVDPDTATSPGSIEAARLAAGSGVQLVDALLDGEATTGFAMVRPPGHHAEPDRAMGFCFFNNIAIAAAHALSRPEVERVLIVDWDVHHGNGTQAAFYGRDDVFVFSAHQWPNYPGTGALHETGAGVGAGYTLNCPLPPGLGDRTYAPLFADVLRPVAERFRPDLVLVSAGFDAHRSDPLADMQVSAEGFAHLCAEVRAIARDHADGRLGLLLEGGYDLVGLSRSARACVEVLAGAQPPPPTGGPDPRGAAAIRAAAKVAGTQLKHGGS